MPEFIASWWGALNFELQVFYGIGIIGIVALVIQMLLSTVFGMDDGMEGGGMDHVEIGDHDSGLSIFSVRGVTAFFVGFGWTGVICTEHGLPLPLTLVIAIVVGTLLMVLIYLMMRTFMRMQTSGTLNYGNAVGQLANVYLTIPPAQRAGGQVETMIQGRLVMAEALQRGPEPIAPGTKVKVIERIGSSTLLVEALDL